MLCFSGFELYSRWVPLNVNKLSTHIDELRILLADKCLDVLAIHETKLDVFNNNSDFYICGYELIRRDSLSDGAGGICFYIKSTINFSVRTELNIDKLENLCIEFRKPNSKPFIVVNWYRPPNSPTGLFSHLVACVAWRFCRAGHRSGVAGKFAREARENERRSREKNKSCFRSNLLAVSLPSPAFIT